MGIVSIFYPVLQSFPEKEISASSDFHLSI